MTNTGRILRGLFAALALIAVLVGVPIFLAVAVGWPLPSAAPVWSDITSTLSGATPLDNHVVWKALAIVIWIGWTQIALGALVELNAARRGLVTPALRGLGLGQGVAGYLIGAISLALPAAATVAGPAPHPGDAHLLTAPAVFHAPDPVPAVAAKAAGTPQPVIEHVVQRRENLWVIARGYLPPDASDADVAAAVRRIFDANAGRTQPDGATLTDGSTIRPGWTLRIEDPSPQSGIPIGAQPERQVTVEPGDTLSGIAKAQFGDGGRYTELFDLNAGRVQSDGRSLRDPSLIRPGWEFRLPAPDPLETPFGSSPATTAPALPSAAAPGPGSVEPSPTEPTTVSTAPPGNAAGHGTNEGPGDGTPVPRGALGAAGAMLAAGVATLVAARRRRRAAERGVGLELPPLPTGTAGVVCDLADADIDTAAAIAQVMRELGVRLANRDPVPVPLVASLDSGHLELLLDRPATDPPAGWSGDAAGWIWRTPLTPNAGASERGTQWLPGLVTVGAAEDGGLLLNLEALGTIGVVGELDTARALVASMTIETATGVLSDNTTVHIVGALSAPRGVPGIETHESLEEAIAAARSDAAPGEEGLTSSGAGDIFELRCHAPDERWPLAVVVADCDRSTAEAIQELVVLAGARRGIAAILLGGCPAGGTQLDISDEVVSVPALGLTCVAQLLAEADIEALGQLLDAADAPAAPPAPSAPPTLFARTDPRIEPGDIGDTGAAAVRLRILGPVTVDGVDLKPQQLAVLAYLVLHPDATADALRDAVWAGKPPTRERFLNTIHELRRAVGADILPASTDGHYRVRGVACDAQDFERLRSAAANDGSRLDAGALRAALEHVSGAPLTYDSRHRRHFSWIDLGNHANRWERIVCDTAHELVTTALEDGDSDLARWAAERGLLASPASELLTHDLVAAHLSAGDRRAAERTADAYARLLEDLGLDEPQTLFDVLDSRQAS